VAKNKLIAPFLKWVGGKRQIMPLILERVPKKYSTYYEPFIGGGAVLFELQPKKAVINDFNTELINVYSVIKSNVNALIKDLKKHKNESDYFYQLRAKDRSEEFNSPFGKYKNPNIVNEPTLKAVHNYFNSCDLKISNGDYENILKNVPKNSFVYLDPPYYPVSESSNFTGYIEGGWDANDQTRLKEVCDRLNARGVKFMLSNSGVDFIKSLYENYNIDIIKANRSINSDGEKRGEVEEVLIRNYE